MFAEFGSNFEDKIPQDGIVFISLSESSKCGACIKLMDAVKKIGERDGVNSIWVDTKKYPMVRYKYGIPSNMLIMVYKDGKFIKRLFPGQGNYSYFEEIIGKINSGQQIDDPDNLKPINSMNPEVGIMRIPAGQFEDWIKDSDNNRYLLPMNTRIIHDSISNEWVIVYVEMKQ